MTAMERSYETPQAGGVAPQDAVVPAESDAPAVVREVVGVFQDVSAMENAVDTLLVEGFDRATISLIASETTIEQKLRHRYDRVSEIEAEPLTQRMAYVDSDSLNEAKAGIAGGLAYVGATAAAGAVVFSGGAAGLAIAAAVASSVPCSAVSSASSTPTRCNASSTRAVSCCGWPVATASASRGPWRFCAGTAPPTSASTSCRSLIRPCC